MKFINIFTNKGLREHDESIRNEAKKEGIEQGIKEGNEKATKLWQEEFDNQINTANENKENMLEDINKEILKLSEINSTNMKKADKELAIDKQIIKVLDCIKKYK